MAKILLIGGMGVIGKIITDNLHEHEFVIADIKEISKENIINIDINNYNDLEEKSPTDIDIIINLAGLDEASNFVSPEDFSKMSDVYVKGSYNVFNFAVSKKIPKVIFASTNHVTDFYENNGYSLLDREISVLDYPKSNSVYGNMKLCAENFGRQFSKKYGIQIFCIRFGTVRPTDKETFSINDRAKRTGFSQRDLIQMIRFMIENKHVKFGIYYGVSENPNKPWDTTNFRTEFKIN